MKQPIIDSFIHDLNLDNIVKLIWTGDIEYCKNTIIEINFSYFDAMK